MDKSDENGPTTYYDYFSVPSHGYIDTDERIDPRGESYFAMDYGDVKIIGCNWNEGKDDPSFATGYLFLRMSMSIQPVIMGRGRPAKRNI